MLTRQNPKIPILINAWLNCGVMLTPLRLSAKSPGCYLTFERRISLRSGLREHEHRSRTTCGQAAGVGDVLSFRLDTTRAARNQPNPRTHERVAHRESRHCRIERAFGIGEWRTHSNDNPI